MTEICLLFVLICILLLKNTLDSEDPNVESIIEYCWLILIGFTMIVMPNIVLMILELCRKKKAKEKKNKSKKISSK